MSNRRRLLFPLFASIALAAGSAVALTS